MLQTALQLGINRVLYESAITLSGDVITRVSSDASQDEAAMALHNQGMELAVGYWTDVIDLASQFVVDLLGVLTRRRPS